MCRFHIECAKNNNDYAGARELTLRHRVELNKADWAAPTPLTKEKKRLLSKTRQNREKARPIGGSANWPRFCPISAWFTQDALFFLCGRGQVLVTRAAPEEMEGEMEQEEYNIYYYPATSE